MYYNNLYATKNPISDNSFNECDYDEYDEDFHGWCDEDYIGQDPYDAWCESTHKENHVLVAEFENYFCVRKYMESLWLSRNGTEMECDSFFMVLGWDDLVNLKHHVENGALVHYKCNECFCHRMIEAIDKSIDHIKSGHTIYWK